MVLSRPSSLLVAALAACFLPISIGYLLFNYATLLLTPRKALRKKLRHTPGFKARKALITGVSTPYGLRLARAFHQTGHSVVGADYQDSILPLHARLSISLVKFRRLKAVASNDLVRELMSLIWSESIDLWIDCSKEIPDTTLATAKGAIEQSTSCICFVPSHQVVQSFSTPQSFLAFAHHHGLLVPDSYPVKSRDDIHNVLNQSRGKKRYVLKESASPTASTPRALLPRRTLSQTYNEVANYKLNKHSQLVLEQYLDGLQRTMTFSIVARGKVQAFVACQEASSGAYQVLSSSSLQSALVRYVASLARHLGDDVSCHVGIEFCIDEKGTETGVEQRVLPVSGRLSAGISGLSFQGTDGSVDLVRAYLSAFSMTTNGSTAYGSLSTNGHEDDIPRPSTASREIYSLANNLFRLGRGISELLKFQASLSRVLDLAFDLARHIATDQECVYDFSDPLPCWYLYQVYIPVWLFISCFQGTHKRARPEAVLQHTIT